MKNPLYLLGQGRGVHPYTPEWFHPHFIPVEVLIGISFPCAAIALLQDKAPGTFVIRDSQSYTGAFGLAVKVEVPPMHVIQNQNKNFGKNHLNYFVMQVYVLDWKKSWQYSSPGIFFLIEWCYIFSDLDNIDPSEFVRHLLIESTPKGVHLKDCKDEPMFGKMLSRYQALYHVNLSIVMPSKRRSFLLVLDGDFAFVLLYDT